MTKVQLKSEAIELLVANKANKALTTAITELMESYAKTANRDTVKRDRIIEIEGDTYHWCNRHEVYEPSSNFRTEKEVACILANKKWQALGKMVNDADAARETAIESQNYEALPELTAKLKEIKEIRTGRYNHDDDALQFPDIVEYNYESDDYIKEEDVK